MNGHPNLSKLHLLILKKICAKLHNNPHFDSAYLKFNHKRESIMLFFFINKQASSLLVNMSVNNFYVYYMMAQAQPKEIKRQIENFLGYKHITLTLRYKEDALFLLQTKELILIYERTNPVEQEETRAQSVGSEKIDDSA